MNITTMRKVITTSILSILSILITFAWDGEGTSQSPYQINNLDDLIELTQSKERLTGKHFIQTQHIDCATLEQWQPIGTSNPFEGNYNGNRKTIKNLRIKTENREKIALFAQTENATIENIIIDASCLFQGKKEIAAIIANARNTTINTCDNHASIISNYQYSESIAGIVGTGFNIQINNCKNFGTILTNKTESDGIGGIIGEVLGSNSTIETCQNIGTIHGANHVGGIAGYFGGQGHIKNSHNQGSIEGTNRVGGIAGIVQMQLIESPKVELCSNAGNISGIEKTGGVVGSSANTRSSCNIGNITATGPIVGGVIGNGNADYCYNKGSIKGVDQVGGIAGSIGEINYSYNRGNIIGQNQVGGLVGTMPGTENKINNSYTTSNITIEGEGTNIGAIVGNLNLGGFVNSNQIKNCFWDNTINNRPAIGTEQTNLDTNNYIFEGKTTTQLTGQSFPITNTDWAYDTQNKNDGYPVLQQLETLDPTKLDTYTITLSNNQGGTINPSTPSIEIAKSGAITLDIKPDPQYTISSITINNVEISTDTTIVLANIDEDKTIQITFADLAAINDNETKQKVKLIQNTLNIENLAGAQITIFSTQGIQMKQYTIESESQNISLETLPKGAYLVRTTDIKGKTETQSIIK